VVKTNGSQEEGTCEEGGRLEEVVQKEVTAIITESLGSRNS
jgi:hypothetical protein